MNRPIFQTFLVCPTSDKASNAPFHVPVLPVLPVAKTAALATTASPPLRKPGVLPAATVQAPAAGSCAPSAHIKVRLVENSTLSSSDFTSNGHIQSHAWSIFSTADQQGAVACKACPSSTYQDQVGDFCPITLCALKSLSASVTIEIFAPFFPFFLFFLPHLPPPPPSLLKRLAKPLARAVPLAIIAAQPSARLCAKQATPAQTVREHYALPAPIKIRPVKLLASLFLPAAWAST